MNGLVGVILLYVGAVLLVNVPGPKLGRLLPYSTIAVGVLTCWIPGLLILTDRW